VPLAAGGCVFSKAAVKCYAYGGQQYAPLLSLAVPG
jgi:hypothetical protein